MNKSQSPKGWTCSKFVEFAHLQRGYDLPLQDRVSGSYPVYGSNGIVGYHHTPKVCGSGVITGRSGSIGEVWYLESDFWPLNTSLYVKDFNNNDPKFAYYFIQNFELASYGTGTGVPTLNRNDVHIVQITYPPLPEQKKIAAILSSVDTVIEKTQAQIDKLNDLKTAMMQEFLTRGVGDEHGNPHTEFKDSPVGRIPVAWEIYDLSQITFNYDAKRVPLKSEERSKRSGGYRYYGASGVIDHVDDYLFDGEYILVGEDGENVVSRNQPLAFIVDGKFWVNNHAHVLAPRNDIDIYYLAEYLESLNYTNIASGSAQPKITQAALNKIQVAIPPSFEQKRIGAIFRSLDINMDVVKREKDKLEHLKKALMQDLLTGKVRVKVDA